MLLPITIKSHLLVNFLIFVYILNLGLTNLSETVCLLFQAAETSIEVPLNATNPAQANMDYVYEAIFELFSLHFKRNLTE